jgi:hypothetical protein
MRGVLVAAYALGIAIPAPATAQVAQAELDAILHEMTPKEIAMRRSACAMGLAPKLAADSRAAGFERPDPSAWCITVLTRSGRDGTLGYMRDPRSNQPTPAINFDSGFVGGWLKHEALPTDAPTMAALLPTADHCLSQQESRAQICSSVGYLLGLRAARGEIITLR